MTLPPAISRLTADRTRWRSNGVKLLILGTGQDEEMLRALAKDLGFQDRVLFLGQIDHAQLPNYLKISDMFCRPSLSEGLGNSLLEAMAAGVPIIGTPVGGIVDFLEDRKTGLLCEVRNPASIAKAIETYRTNDELRRTIIEKGRELVMSHYDWDQIAQRMRTIYERLLA